MAVTSESDIQKPEEATPVVESRRSRVRVVLAFLLVTAGTCLGVFGFLWWSDRDMRLARDYLESEEYPKALQKAERYLSRNPGDTRAMILRGRALSGMNRHEDADDAFKRVATLSGGFPNDPPALSAWADSLLHLKKWSRAESLLALVVKADAENRDALYKLTVARIRLRKYREALKSAEHLATVDADQANVIIGTVHHDMGHRRKALEAWERVLKANPQAKNLSLPANEFLTMVGEELLELGQPARAVTILQQSLAKRPSADAYRFVGRAYAELNQPNEATAAWRNAVRLDPRDLQARRELANMALLQGSPREAIDWLRPMVDLGRIDSASAYILQRAYGRLKQTDLADQWRKRTEALRLDERIQSDLNQALRDNPSPFWNRFLDAYRLARDGEWEQAKGIIDQLKQTRPGTAAVNTLSNAVNQRGPLPSLKDLRIRVNR